VSAGRLAGAFYPRYERRTSRSTLPLKSSHPRFGCIRSWRSHPAPGPGQMV